MKLLFHDPTRPDPGEQDAERGAGVYWHYTARYLRDDFDVATTYRGDAIPETRFDIAVFNRVDLIRDITPHALLGQVRCRLLLLWEHYLPSCDKINLFNELWDSGLIHGMIFNSDYHLAQYVSAGLDTQLSANAIVHEGGVRSDQLPPFAQGNRENAFIYASVPHRGLGQFLDIWPRILKHLPTHRLYVTGGVDLYMGRKRRDFTNEMHSLVKRIRALPNVKCLGLLPTRELYGYFSRCQALLYPAQGEELSCISLHEAMYLGCVPVVSSQGVMPYKVKDGDNGRLVPGVPKCYLRKPADPDSKLFRDRFVATTVESIRNGFFDDVRSRMDYDFTWESRVKRLARTLKILGAPKAATGLG